MFVITRIQDTVVLEPTMLKEPLYDAICYALNEKYANKVLIDIGLALHVYDLLHVGDGRLVPGRGDVHIDVQFRLHVYRPFVGEVCLGRCGPSNADGLHIRLGFFDDVFVSKDNLPEPSKFDESEQLWYWECDVGAEESIKFYLERDKIVRFRVIGEKFTDINPSIKKAAPTMPEEKPIAYRILASIGEQGLGCIDWWAAEDAEEADDENVKMEVDEESDDDAEGDSGDE